MLAPVFSRAQLAKWASTVDFEIVGRFCVRGTGLAMAGAGTVARFGRLGWLG